MIKSMTGFGRGECKVSDGKVIVEIKAINHKFFDATLKLPENISIFEDKIKEILQKSIKRGKVNLNLICNGGSSKYERIRINKKVAKNYRDELLRLKRYLGIRDDIGTQEIIALPGVLNHEVMEKNLTKLWPKIKIALDRALARLSVEREREGRSICADVSKRARKIGAMLRTIKSRSHLNIEEYRKRFADRVNDLTGSHEIDMGRLEMEVAIFAKNSDISEETTRLGSHLENLKKTIIARGEVGKKLDFIAQELHREINTIGSKASDFKISKNVIEIKSEIEKIREQAKNVE